MPSHWEVRYWSNGVRRSDIYLKESQAVAAKNRIEAVTKASRVELMTVTTTWSAEKFYRGLRREYIP